MPISYAMNSCASTWIPADDPRKPGPPLRLAQLTRAADSILIAEDQAEPYPDMYAAWLWGRAAGGNLCPAIFAHPAGKVGNFIFYDGHAKSKKWLATLYPLTENNWELLPNPDPNNRTINGAPGCQYKAPPGPDAALFRSAVCQGIQ